MKFLHLADLHIGKVVREFSMLEDQDFALSQILDIARTHKPEAVVIAGDVYDKSVPGADAVKVFDRFLSALASLGTSVLIISGNHDSPERLGFASEIMSGRDVHIYGVFDGKMRTVTLADAYGEVRFHLLPFIRPADVRRFYQRACETPPGERETGPGTVESGSYQGEAGDMGESGETGSYHGETGDTEESGETGSYQGEAGDTGESGDIGSYHGDAGDTGESGDIGSYHSDAGDTEESAENAPYQDDVVAIESYQDTVAAVVKSCKIDSSVRNVFVSHQFYAAKGAEPDRSDSEREIIGGLDKIDSATCRLADTFDYVALGHLHGPQRAGGENIRYSGSLLKYSKSECGHIKTALLVELKNKGVSDVTPLPITPLRDMRRIKGPLAALIGDAARAGANPEDYLYVTLTDEEEIHDAIGKLRAVYPNVTEIAFDNSRTNSEPDFGEGAAAEKATPVSLFEDFFYFQNGAALDGGQRKIVGELLGAEGDDAE